MKFTIPDGFEMPTDAEVGGSFQAVGTFQDNGDGTLSLVQIDGSDIEYADEEDGEEVEEETETETEEEEYEGPGAMMGRARRAGVPMQM